VGPPPPHHISHCYTIRNQFTTRSPSPRYSIGQDIIRSRSHHTRQSITSIIIQGRYTRVGHVLLDCMVQPLLEQPQS
jgi:hypothetical protein